MSLVGEFGYKEWEDEIRLLGVDEYDKIIVAVCKDKIVGSMAYKKVDENVAELKRIYIYIKISEELELQRIYIIKY